MFTILKVHTTRTFTIVSFSIGPTWSLFSPETMSLEISQSGSRTQPGLGSKQTKKHLSNLGRLPQKQKAKMGESR